MIESAVNLFKLAQILKERGNWRLIRQCRRQLLDFVFCRSGLNRRPALLVIPYWLGLLRGLDMLVWRLETFGFLFPPGATETDKRKLNRYL